MNQKEIWLVVKPTVGLPLFLGSVAATSLLVHYAILSHTTWYPAYWQGSARLAASAPAAAPAPAPAPMAAAPAAASAPAAPAAK